MANKVKFQTYVDNRNFLKVGNYIAIVCFDDIISGKQGDISKVVEINEVNLVDEGDCFKVVGVAEKMDRLKKEHDFYSLNSHLFAMEV